jgi:WD40 repeat protein
LWESDTGKEVCRGTGPKQPMEVWGVAFSPEGRLVAAATGGETVHVWDVAKGEEVVALKGSSGWHRGVAFAPAGNIVAAGGSDGKVRLWDARTGELQATVKGHGDEVFSVAFSPDGKTLASTSQDQTLRLWPINERAAGQKQ